MSPTPGERRAQHDGHHVVVGVLPPCFVEVDVLDVRRGEHQGGVERLLLIEVAVSHEGFGELCRPDQLTGFVSELRQIFHDDQRTSGVDGFSGHD